jgi:sigma-B regulation protein RsbU (phosphoserine phosphatase)
LPLRLRLVLAIGLPLLAVYGTMTWLLAVRWHREAVAQLEAAAIQRVAALAGRLDDRARLGGPAAVSAGGLADLDREVARAGRDARFLLVDSSGRILHDSAAQAPVGGGFADTAPEDRRAEVEAAVRDALGGRRNVLRVQGVVSPGIRWAAYAPVPALGGAVFATVPESKVLEGTRVQIRLALGLLGIGLVVLLGIVWAMSAHVTRPLARLARAVDTLGHGDLTTRVEGVATRDEIGALAKAFDRMVGDLREHVAALERATAARERMEGELLAARGIQTAMLPKTLPRGPGFDLAARNAPARHVAGDFYDAFDDRGAVVLVVADVSGKGLPSALYMAVSKAVLRRALAVAPSLAAAVKETNDALEREGIGAMYLTAFVGRYEPGSGRLRYVNAGHPAPWRTGRGAPAGIGETTGGPIGMLPGRRFEERETALEEGESLVVFTDGVPEASREDGEFFGDERLAALLGSSPAGESAEAACGRIAAAVDSFQSGNLADDVTVMVLRRLPDRDGREG